MMIKKWILAFVMCCVLPALAAAQGPVVRLQVETTNDTLSSNGDSVTLSARDMAFGSVKIQTIDSYSGTWEVQCSVDGTTFDEDNELSLTLVDATTSVVTSVTDTVGIWDVMNAAGCRAIKVVATAGFAASDTLVYIEATQTGGGGGGGGGAGGGGDASLAEQQTQTTHLAAIETAVEGTLVVGDGAGALNVICDSGCAGGTQYAEDAIHASGDTGTLGLAVRNDAGTALAADGDNIPLMVNSAGALYTVGTVTATNLDVQIGGSDTVTVTATDLDVQSGGADILSTTAFNSAFGTAGAADAQVLSVQGIASGTALTVSATNLDVQIGGSDTLTVTATNLDVQSGGADVATEATLASAAADLDTLASAIYSDPVHGNAVTDRGPHILCEAGDIDGSAQPNAVTEGQSARVKCTLGGAVQVTQTNEAGTLATWATAAATSDNFANPTTTQAFALAGIWDGSTWDRWTGAVTNAGTFATQVDGAALTALQLIDDAQTGDSVHYRTSAGSTEDEHEVKATAGRLFSVAFTNTNAAVRYWRCSNLTAANTTPGTSTVFLGLAIPGSTTGAGFTHTFGPNGVAFSTALTCWFVTGAADSDVAEVAADEIKAIYTYK